MHDEARVTGAGRQEWLAYPEQVVLALRGEGYARPNTRVDVKPPAVGEPQRKRAHPLQMRFGKRGRIGDAVAVERRFAAVAQPVFHGRSRLSGDGIEQHLFMVAAQADQARALAALPL